MPIAKVVYQRDFLVFDWILGRDQNENTIKQHNNISYNKSFKDTKNGWGRYQTNKQTNKQTTSQPNKQTNKQTTLTCTSIGIPKRLVLLGPVPTQL